MARRTLEWLCAGVVTVGMGLGPRLARAGCDVIPPAAKTFGSTLGLVDRALAGPRDWVTITLPSCSVPTGPSSPRRTYFVEGDKVTIRFDASLLVTLPGMTSPPNGHMDLPGENVEVDPKDAHRLRFQVPNTVKRPERPQGLAGPVQIMVKTSTGELLAQVDKLFLPTTKCDRDTPDDVFGNFTILPEDNDFDLKESRNDFINMTLDGWRDLLIPFRYGRVPVSARGPVAFVQQGYGAFPSGLAGETISQSLVATIAAGTSEFMLVRPYSAEGFPLPPVVGIDGKGGLFGTTDAERSVVRISRAVQDQTAHPTVHDLVGMLSPVRDDSSMPQAGIGPIVLENGFFTNRFGVYRCPQPALLSGLKAGTSVTAFGVDEGLLGVRDLNRDGDEFDVVPDILGHADASTQCATTTRIAAAEEPTFVSARTLLDVRGDLTAFLKDSDQSLRVFRGTKELTKGMPVMKVDRDSVVNAERLVVASSMVFFRQAPASSATSTAPTAAPLLVLDAGPSKAVLRDTHISVVGAVVDPEYATAVGITAAASAQFYDGTAHSLTYQAVHAAVNHKLVAMTVPESSTTALSNGDGDTTDDILVVTTQADSTPPTSPTSPPVSARAVKVTSSDSKSWVLFVTAESDEGPGCAGNTSSVLGAPCDLNGDGHTGDLVLRVYDPASPGSTTAIQAVVGADDFVTDGAVVAFRTQEIVLPGGQISTFPDPVMAAYDLATNRLVRTNVPALQCTDPGYEWMHPYAVRGRDIYFLSPHTCCDPFGRELNVFSIDTFALKTVTPPGGPLATAVTVTAINGAPMVEVHPAGGATPVLYGDRDGDGVFDSFDRCVGTPDVSYFDDDLDGLGTACDRELCTDATPSAISLPRGGQARASLRGLATEAGDYALARLKATAACLQRLAEDGGAEPPGAGPTDRCRGYFAGSYEVAPTDRTTAQRIALARDRFFSSVCLGCGGVDRVQAERVLQRYAEAAIAVSHAGFGDVEAQISTSCATALAKTVNVALEVMLAPTQAALETHASEVSLGRIRNHVVELESQADLAVPVPKACEPDELRRIEACGKDPTHPTDPERAADCLKCVAFRQVADALRTIY